MQGHVQRPVLRTGVDKAHLNSQRKREPGDVQVPLHFTETAGDPSPTCPTPGVCPSPLGRPSRLHGPPAYACRHREARPTGRSLHRLLTGALGENLRHLGRARNPGTRSRCPSWCPNGCTDMRRMRQKGPLRGCGANGEGLLRRMRLASMLQCRWPPARAFSTGNVLIVALGVAPGSSCPRVCLLA